MLKKISYVVVDYLYAMRGHAGSAIYRKIPNHYLFGNKDDIILIPGLYEKWNFLKIIGDSLSYDGYKVHVLLELKRNQRPISEQARVVHDYLEKNDIRNATIVSHSKGGLIGLHYLIKYNNDNRVQKVIAVAAPFSGSHIGRIARLKAIRELMPHSDSIKDLTKNSVSSKVVSIYPTYDNHVWHKDGSYLSNEAKNIEHGVKGHHRILFDKKLLQLIKQEIGQ